MSQLPLFLALLLAFIPCSTAFTGLFNFTSFHCSQGINCSGDAINDRFGALDLTSTDNASSNRRIGWAVYGEPIKLYDDSATRFVPGFQSIFSFEIVPKHNNCSGDGFAFFMAPTNWTPKEETFAGGLGLFNESLDEVNRRIIAIEFDTYKNVYDPSANHMGIDVNSIKSRVATNWTLDESRSLNGTAVIGYNPRTGTLSSLLRYQNDTLRLNMSLDINLTAFLPETVVVGFSAAAGDCGQAHRILTWNFSKNISVVPTSKEAPISVVKNFIIIILLACLALLVIMVIMVIIVIMVVVKIRRGKKKGKSKEEETREEETDGSADVTMNLEAGSRKFRYIELAAATNDFSKEKMVGEGGFGSVYRATLSDTDEVVAVKRFFKGSGGQGKKEYVAEATVISRLRHRNLVRLIGWCHERGEFLLVYEYMEGGSLDSHLFKDCPVLSWAHRRKVVLGLASAVLYLHEECEQCVVHRDIKLSNIMVDPEFNARLGDFGLAKLTNHGLTPKTTMVAGTLGYLAPECLITGKANTQSDVYSFGMVLLEIATGWRATCLIGEEEMFLVEWIWELYRLDSLMEAVDKRLGSEFDQQGMERTMVVGLWCVHRDPKRRPTMREVIRVLSFEVEIPRLSDIIPSPVHVPQLSSSLMSSSSGTTETPKRVMTTEPAGADLLWSQG